MNQLISKYQPALLTSKLKRKAINTRTLLTDENLASISENEPPEQVNAPTGQYRSITVGSNYTNNDETLSHGNNLNITRSPGIAETKDYIKLQ